MENPAEIEVQYLQKANGFELVASLSKYSSIPMFICMALVTAWITFDFTKDWSEAHNPYRVVTFILLLLLSMPFWWVVILSAVGTQRVSLEFPTIEVTIGVGSIQFRNDFDIRNIGAVTEKVYIPRQQSGRPRRRSIVEHLPILHIEFGPKTPSIVLEFIQPIDELLGPRKDFAFGRYLNHNQRRYILRKIQQSLPAAT